MYLYCTCTEMITLDEAAAFLMDMSLQNNPMPRVKEGRSTKAQRGRRNLGNLVNEHTESGWAIGDGCPKFTRFDGCAVDWMANGKCATTYCEKAVTCHRAARKKEAVGTHVSASTDDLIGSDEKWGRLSRACVGRTGFQHWCCCLNATNILYAYSISGTVCWACACCQRIGRGVFARPVLSNYFIYCISFFLALRDVTQITSVHHGGHVAPVNKLPSQVFLQAFSLVQHGPHASPFEKQ